jgi:hypothetical protein
MMAVNDLSGLGIDSAPETHANIGVEEFSGGCCVNETLSVILHLGSDTLWSLTGIYVTTAWMESGKWGG